VGIREANAFVHKLIKVRSGDFIVRVMCLNIPHSKIIGQDDNDVGFLYCPFTSAMLALHEQNCNQGQDPDEWFTHG
jgi:hypothetical protein